MSENTNEKLKTYHLMIIDRSGSMGSVIPQTISGINEQLVSIKKAEEDFKDQEQIACIVIFNHQVDTTTFWKKKISEIEAYDSSNYQPDGNTALYDAIGSGINKLKGEIKEELSQRKANVIVTIFTDGDENASIEFRSTSASNLVKEVQDSGQWTVTFIGCGNNVFEVAQSLNIRAGNTLSYSDSPEGNTEAFRSMAQGRYAVSAMYSQSLEKGLDTCNVNQTHDFFANLDLDDDIVKRDDTIKDKK